MNRLTKNLIYASLSVLGIFALVYLFLGLSGEKNIIGRVIDYSNSDYAKSNADSYMFFSFIILAAVVVFAIVGYLDNHFERKSLKEECDRIVGKPE